MKIGVIVELLRKPLFEAIDYAAQIGVSGVQLCAKHGEDGLNLAECSDAELAELRAYCESRNLSISAICGDTGVCYQTIKGFDERIVWIQKLVDAAVKLNVHIITTHIGYIPDDRNDPVYPIMLLNVRAAAQYAAAHGVTFAIETGPEKADILKSFIEDIDSPGVGVNLDPANLRMVSCEDPIYAVEVLAPYIVHTHAKDGVNLYCGSSALAYGLRNPDGSRRQLLGRAAEYKELPLGQGQVDWDGYLAALKKIGYQGFLTIERECGDDPVTDIRMAVEFLTRKLAEA